VALQWGSDRDVIFHLSLGMFSLVHGMVWRGVRGGDRKDRSPYKEGLDSGKTNTVRYDGRPSERRGRMSNKKAGEEEMGVQVV